MKDNIKDGLSNMEKDKLLTSKSRNKLLIYIGVMIILNYLMSNLINSSGAHDMSGHSVSPNDFKKSIIITLVIGIPFFGFLIGTILSIIPYKKFSYGNKYLCFSLYTIIVIHAIMFLLGVRNLILW